MGQTWGNVTYRDTHNKSQVLHDSKILHVISDFNYFAFDTVIY